jgi:hypothetical protein
MVKQWTCGARGFTESDLYAACWLFQTSKHGAVRRALSFSCVPASGSAQRGGRVVSASKQRMMISSGRSLGPYMQIFLELLGRDGLGATILGEHETIHLRVVLAFGRVSHNLPLCVELSPRNVFWLRSCRAAHKSASESLHPRMTVAHCHTTALLALRRPKNASVSIFPEQMEDVRERTAVA